MKMQSFAASQSMVSGICLQKGAKCRHGFMLDIGALKNRYLSLSVERTFGGEFILKMAKGLVP